MHVHVCMYVLFGWSLQHIVLITHSGDFNLGSLRRNLFQEGNHKAIEFNTFRLLFSGAEILLKTLKTWKHVIAELSGW